MSFNFSSEIVLFQAIISRLSRVVIMAPIDFYFFFNKPLFAMFCGKVLSFYSFLSVATGQGFCVGPGTLATSPLFSLAIQFHFLHNVVIFRSQI